MSTFKELDPAELIFSEGRWYVGVKPRMCEYLHEDLKLYVETVNPITREYNGLWNTEFEALSACRQYYVMHGRTFPYAGRFTELRNAASITNTSSNESQHMVFN